MILWTTCVSWLSDFIYCFFRCLLNILHFRYFGRLRRNHISQLQIMMIFVLDLADDLRLSLYCPLHPSTPVTHLFHRILTSTAHLTATDTEYLACIWYLYLSGTVFTLLVFERWKRDARLCVLWALCWNQLEYFLSWIEHQRSDIIHTHSIKSTMLDNGKA